MSGDLRITAEEGRLWQRSYVGAVEGMKRLSRVGSGLDWPGLVAWVALVCWLLGIEFACFGKSESAGPQFQD